MLNHLLKYYSKIYFYNKANIMWNFIFPFIYITIFFLALSGLNKPQPEFSEDPIRLAIIADEQQEATDLAGFLENFGQEGLDQQESGKTVGTKQESLYLRFTFSDPKTAKELLEEQKIQAIIRADDPTVIEEYNDLSNLKAGLLSQFLETYESVRKTTVAISERYLSGDYEFEQSQADLEAVHQEAIDLFAADSTETESSTSSVLIFFFSAIAYIAFYPINAGVSTLEEINANQSTLGLRNSTAPISKTKMFFALFVPRWIIHCLFTLLIYLYVNLLGINLGHNYLQISLLLILCTTCSVLIGTAIGALFSFSQGLKVGISVALPLTLGFASGMMHNGMPRIISQYIPWFSKINPIGIVSNGLYILYSDPTLNRFYQQIIMLSIITFIAFILTIIGLRRNSYESL